ncbi:MULTISPECIES: DUF6235 family protein [unclassified Streptomyces]|uniref:DUF6235 family protein n=1 Tax=unclassified Streptomyces TaxID=2593676 RepID=UPI0009A0CE96|nr:DUF6235 family protein [Streptomyces sp. CB01883]
MRHFTVRAESGMIGFLPVRALMGAGVTAAWPRPARVGLKLIAPDDPASATPGDQEGRVDAVRRLPPDRLRLFHHEHVIRSFREVGRAWLKQVGPCRIDVIDADLLDDGSREFFATLADQSEGLVDIRREELANSEEQLSATVSGRELRIDHLARSRAQLSEDEVDFLHEQALRYLGLGDSWTAERILRAVLRHRAAPSVRTQLRLACSLLGRPLEADFQSLRRSELDPGTQAAGARRPAFRLVAGWDLLEQWSGTANQIEKNAVHQALFAVVDRTVFRTYSTSEVTSQPQEFFVRLRQGLVLKIRIRDFDMFEIAYVGPVGETPGIDLETGRAA